MIFPRLRQWSSVLSSVVLEQERMLPILLDLLSTDSDMELRPLTGLLRNLARHSSNKDHLGKMQNGTASVLVSFRLKLKSKTKDLLNTSPSYFVLAATNMVKVLVSKLPDDGLQKTPSSEVVVNTCGALNNLVTCSSLAARDISYFNGLPKLMGIKTSHDNR